MHDGYLAEQLLLRIGGAGQEIRDDLLRDTTIRDDVVEVRHENGFGEQRKVAGLAGVHIETALADDIGVIGCARTGIPNQRSEFLRLGCLELGAGFLHRHVASVSMRIPKIIISPMNGIRIIPPLGYNLPSL